MHSFLLPFFLTAVQAAAGPIVHTDGQLRAILQTVMAHQDTLDKQLERFGYTETMKREEDGKQKALEVYDVTLYKGRKVRRLISRNGKPLEGSALAKENGRIEKQIHNLEDGKIPPLSNRRVRMEDLLHCSRFSDVREAQQDGRTVWLANFHPNPNVRPANVDERFVHNLDGKLGVDPQSMQLVTFDFVLRDAFNVGGGLWFSMKPGTHYADQETWLFSKIWLPKLHQFDMNAKAMIGVKLAINETTTYSHFEEFAVNAHELDFSNKVVEKINPF